MTNDDAAQAITTALRLIKEALFTLGSDGDECIQRLMAVEATFDAGDMAAARRAVLQAFQFGFAEQNHAGLSAAEADWPNEPALRPAYEIGRQAAQLNILFREKNLSSGWNIGPFDRPALRMVLEQLGD